MSSSMNRKRKLGHISVETKNFLLNEVKLELGGDPQKYDAFISIMKSVITAGKTPDALSRAVGDLTELLNGYPNLIAGLNSFLPATHQLIIHHSQNQEDQELEGNSQIIEPMIDFMNKVKLRFIRTKPAIYTQFLDLLDSNSTLDDHLVCGDICALIGGHPDLQRTFTALVNIDDHHHMMIHEIENQGLSLCHNVKEKLAHNSGKYLKFLKLLHDHASGDMGSVELQMCFENLVQKCPILLEQLGSFLQACERYGDEQRKKSKAKVGEGKTIKIRLHNYNKAGDDEGLNPSYQMIRRSKSSRYSSVLNQSWVCAPSESSSSTSGGKHDDEIRRRRRSRQQEMMDKREDKLYELNMLMHTAASTIDKLKSIMDGFANANGNSTALIRCTNQLSASQLKCIKYLYGDQGKDIVRMMDDNPEEWLDRLIKRLHHKQHQWANAVHDLQLI